jgi:ABC-2 type transport system permease protein
MIRHQATLIRREIWEHPAIWVSPVVITVIVSLLTLTGQVTISAFGEAVNLAIVGAQNVDESHRTVVLTSVLLGVSSVFAFGTWIIMMFYSLDALYAERKDKSILFWRSLPITDTESVVSKLLTALVVVPLVALVAMMLTHVIILSLTAIWVKSQGGNAIHLVWAPVRLADLWIACVLLAVTLPLWLAPFVGWFLFVSTFAKRSPFLTGFLPILVLPMLERMLIGTHLFWDAIFVRTVRPPIIDFGTSDWMESGKLPDNFDPGSIALTPQVDLAGFLASPSLWVGLVVCALFTIAAIYVRRYRDESY